MTPCQIDSCGPDAGLMMNLLGEAQLKIPKYRCIVPQKPVSAPVAVAAPDPVIPNAPVQPPVGAQPPVLPVRAQPPVMIRGTSANNPIDVLDSDDELFEEMDLTPVQEERMRRYFRRIRNNTSSSSSQ